MNTHWVSCYFTWIFFKEHFCSCVHTLSLSLCLSPFTSEMLGQGDSCQCSDECVSVYQCHMPPDVHTYQCLMTLVYNINTHSHAHHGFNVLQRRWKCWTENRELWHQCSVCVLHADAHGGVLAFEPHVFVDRCMFTTTYSRCFWFHPQVILRSSKNCLCRWCRCKVVHRHGDLEPEVLTNSRQSRLSFTSWW